MIETPRLFLTHEQLLRYVPPKAMATFASVKLFSLICHLISCLLYELFKISSNFLNFKGIDPMAVLQTIRLDCKMEYLYKF